MQLKEQFFQLTQERFGRAPDQCSDQQLYEALLLLTRGVQRTAPPPRGSGSSTIFLLSFCWESC